MFCEEGANGGFQFLGRVEAATPDLFFRKCSKPAFNQVQPTGCGRGKVNVETWATDQPALNSSCLVGGIVVHDQMNVQIRRHVGFNGIEELAELCTAMAAVHLSDDFT